MATTMAKDLLIHSLVIITTMDMDIIIMVTEVMDIIEDKKNSTCSSAFEVYSQSV